MIQLLLAAIYLSFISPGLPDSLPGLVWPAMYNEFGIAVSYAGIICKSHHCFTASVLFIGNIAPYGGYA